MLQSVIIKQLLTVQICKRLGAHRIITLHKALRRSGKMQAEKHIGHEESPKCAFRTCHISVSVYNN